MLNAAHEKHIVLKGIETCAGEWILRQEAQNDIDDVPIILCFPAKHPQDRMSVTLSHTIRNQSFSTTFVLSF